MEWHIMLVNLLVKLAKVLFLKIDSDKCWFFSSFFLLKCLISKTYIHYLRRSYTEFKRRRRRERGSKEQVRFTHYERFLNIG